MRSASPSLCWRTTIAWSRYSCTRTSSHAPPTHSPCRAEPLGSIHAVPVHLGDARGVDGSQEQGGPAGAAAVDLEVVGLELHALGALDLHRHRRMAERDRSEERR